MYRILVLGDGYTAFAVTAYFRSKNQRVFCVIRDESGKKDLEAIGAEPIVTDITARGCSAEFPSAQFVVIAPEIFGISPEIIHKTHLEGVANFLNGIRKNPVPTFILYLSSVIVWGDMQGAWVDESVVPKPNTEIGKLLLEAENQMLESGYLSAVFRLGDIYGPGHHEVLTLREEKKMGLGEDGYLNFIHRDDLMSAMPIILKRIKKGSVLIGVDHEPVLKSEFYGWLARQMGISLPEGTIVKCRPSGIRCRNTDLRMLGYHFLKPTFRDGYQTLIQDPRLSVLGASGV